MKDRVVVNVAGAVTLEVYGRRTVPRSRKAQALLAYLALSGRIVTSRAFLAALLWSEVPSSNAQMSLRQILREIRSELPDLRQAIVIGRNEVTVDYDWLTTDIDQLVANLGLGVVGTGLTLEGALGSDLLAGLDDLSETFQEWLSESRASLERRVLDTYSVACSDPRFDWRSRELMAAAVAAREELSETACRVLMQAAANRGDTGTALRLYERLYNVLDKQMGMEPSPDTQELVVAIKNGTFGFDGQAATDRRAPISGATSVGGEPLLVIVPFREIGGTVDRPQVGELLAEDLSAAIYAQREIRVIAATTVRHLLRDGRQPEEIADQLNAGYLLTGSILFDGTSCKLTAELSRTNGSVVIWAETMEVEYSQLLSVQSRIAQSISRQLIPSLRNTELRIAHAFRIDNLSAYHLVLRAQDEIYALEPGAFADAERLLRLGLARDPTFPVAHVAMADWHSLRLGQGWSRDPEHDRSEINLHTRTAIRLGGVNGRALAMLAHNQAIYSRAYDDALQLISEAVELTPNDAETLMWSSPTLAYTENGDAAVRNAVKAIDLSPYDPLLFRYQHFASLGFFAQGDYHLAAEYGLSSMHGNPNYTSNLRVTAASLHSCGRKGDAAEIRDQVLAIEPDFSVSAFVKRQAFRDPKRRRLFGQQLIEVGFPL